MPAALIAGLLLALQNGAPLVRIPDLAPAPKGDAVLAKVGGVEIHADDVAGLLWESRADEILNDVVFYQLIKTPAEAKGIIVTDADVKRRVAETLKDVTAEIQPGEDPAAALAAQGFTPGRLFLRIKTDLLLTGLANLAFKPENFVKVSTILVVPKTAPDGSPDPASVAQAKATIARAAARLRAGESWDAVAGDTIEDPTGKKTGGYLGWRSLDIFPAAVRTELAGLAPGAFTTPAQTNSGLQIFRIDAAGRTLSGKDLEDLKTAVLPDLRTIVLRDVRAGAKVEIVGAPKPKG